MDVQMRLGRISGVPDPPEILPGYHAIAKAGKDLALQMRQHHGEPLIAADGKIVSSRIFLIAHARWQILEPVIPQEYGAVARRVDGFLVNHILGEIVSGEHLGGAPTELRQLDEVQRMSLCRCPGRDPVAIDQQIAAALNDIKCPVPERCVDIRHLRRPAGHVVTHETEVSEDC